MSTKIEYYSQKIEQATREITQPPERWMGFLNASSRLYKYPFVEQLQIYSQRPNATAVADYDTWNKRMNRYVKRGSAGIALVNESGNGRNLRYVFDVAETGTRQNSRPVYLWKMTEEHAPDVQKALENAFGVRGLPLADELSVLSLSLATEYWEEHKEEIFDIVADSALMQYNNDSAKLRNAFTSIVANSAAYALMSRSTVDENAYFSSDDFRGAAEFNTIAAVNALGLAVSNISAQVFREMERAVRIYDRAKLMAERNENYGKDDIHAGRGLLHPEYSAASDGRPRPADEVRIHAPDVAEGKLSDTLQRDDTDRHNVPAPVGHAGGSEREVRAVDERPREAESAPGQSERPDGLGAAHEYAGGTSGRDGDSGVYHGEAAESDQLSFFGTDAQIAPEAEQIKAVESNPDIRKPLAESNKPSAFAISDLEIDNVLRLGSGFSGGKLRIYALYQQQGDAKERIAFLKKEYGIGGCSYAFADGSHGFVEYQTPGIHVVNHEYNTERRLRWSEVDKRLDALCADSLLVSGKYLSDEERGLYAALVEKYDGDVPMPVPRVGFPEKAEIVPEQSAPMTEGSAAAGKVSLEDFEAEYNSAYDKLYSSEAEAGEISHRFDVQYENDAEFRELVNAFVAKRQDAVSSDRETAAAVIAFDNLMERNKTLEDGNLSKVETETARQDSREETHTEGIEPAQMRRNEPSETTEAENVSAVMTAAESAPAIATPEGKRREMTELEKKAAEIAEPYYDMSMQEKINLIAPTFGARSGRIDRSLCTGKWRGTSDVSIVFDNGVSLFLGNDRTPNAKKLPVQNEMVNSAVVQYNPQIVALTKETALKALRKREAKDNAIAVEKGLKPYKVLTVELDDGTQSVREGWYYVTIAVDGKIHALLETGLNYNIKNGREDKLSNVNRNNYFVAGALKDEDVDFVFDNVGFSTSMDLYTTWLTDEVRERAEKALSEREAEEQTAAVPPSIAPSSFVQQNMQNAEALSSQETQEQAQTSEIQEIGQDAPNHEIVARFQSLLPRRDGTETLNQIVITSDADGYHNHFFYDDTTGKGALSTNGHATVKDAIADVYKRFPAATGYYRYYSTHRPFMPGSYPKMNGFERFTNFDEGKIFCDEIGREAWGYVEYPAPLSAEKQKNYELLRTLDRAAPEVVVSDNVAVGRGLPEFLREVPEEVKPVYKIEANPRSTGSNDTHFLQAYSQQPDGTLTIGNVLYIGSYRDCIDTRQMLLDGVVTPEEVREATVEQFGNLETVQTLDAVAEQGENVDTAARESETQGADDAQQDSETVNAGQMEREPVEDKIELVELPTVPQNFRITDDHLGEGGAKAKFRANMDAIHTLKRLESEGRNATPEEQKVLSEYVGWGGLPDAFDDGKSAWAHEYQELKAALTDEEYAAARGSVLNAHYTSPTVIKAIYEAIGNMGFEHGNILEPSMGVGNFFGLLPESMTGSNLYGVELDSITGRIAQKLYPKADITVAGFETTDRRDFFDVAVGNVPFGNYKVNDKAYNKLGFSIHNYFFAKTLDQVRPGGVVAFVTSRYTMDSKDPSARKYIAERAELLGAIRLPNNAFRANAGTDVVSDILFLQKRDRAIEILPDWVYLGQTPDGISMNSYFLEHPEMVLGEIGTENTQYGRDELTVNPIPGADLAEQLHAAMQNIGGQYALPELIESDVEMSGETIPADPNVRNYSYTVVDGKVYFRENSGMSPCKLSDKAADRVKGMITLRNILRELMDYQLQNYSDEDIHNKQQELNAAYDNFTAEFGLINSRANANVFNADSSYYLLCGLEDVDEDGKLKSKSDIFTKRTIRPDIPVTSVDTSVEALAVSIGEKGKVDLDYMVELLLSHEEYMDGEIYRKTLDKVIDELQGVIFKNPQWEGWETADEYLSGNVREKLREAKAAAKDNPRYAVNVAALEKVQPKDLDASEIEVKLGATWIDPEYVQQFMVETFKPDWWVRGDLSVKYLPVTAEWQITGQNRVSKYDVMAYTTYGTKRISGYKILENTLNLKDVRVYDTIKDENGKDKRVLNRQETTIAQQKQQMIKDAYRDWIWKDPDRRRALVAKYNEIFNSERPREYDGSHIRFVGMSSEIKLREHQQNAIAHALYGGNTLLAHEVGAGKTFEMAAAAMEGKRLGLCHKSLFVVPKHLTQQWASEFLRLYPNANLLVATPKDFETANRKKFCARIATGDYDAIIIGHSQFEKIPVSLDRQKNMLQSQIDDLTEAIAETKEARGERISVKQMEKTRKGLQAKLEKLMSTERKDDVVTFEQLGVDRLFVDEAHSFKNLYVYTKMQNVAGISTTDAQKSSDMYIKCRYMDEITGGKGVVFATGTPVSNSMTELYTMMRYLQYDTLQRKGMTFFDAWAANFGETTTAIELAPEGTGYRARTRFAKFFNLPELMSMFKETADIKTADQLNLPVPKAKFETVVVQPSEIQKKMVADLSERAARVHNGMVNPSEDNMLKITSDGRKIGLDQRLMNPLLPDDPDSKLNACVRNVLKIWEDGKDEHLTQLLFCDLSTPGDKGKFNVYDDIKAKLIAGGVPEQEIAFIHDADSDTKKKELFSKVRNGQVRVLLGSTQKMGTGTNVQERLIAVHHLDCPWKPSDIEQRNGRIIRQGNHNPEVQIYQYVTEGTFDAYLYQTLENKQKFISQIMTSKSPVRACDDVDEQTLSYAEIKALCAGDPRIKEKMDLDVEVARLKVLRAGHQRQQFRLQDRLSQYFPSEIETAKYHIEGISSDIRRVLEHPQGEKKFCGMEVSGKSYVNKADAGEAILKACENYHGIEKVSLGNYRGFSMSLMYDTYSNEFQIALKGEMTYWVGVSESAIGTVTKLDNALDNIPKRKETVEHHLEELYAQRKATEAEVGKPFPQEKELAEKSARLAALDVELNLDEHGEKDEKDDVDDRPSVLKPLYEKQQGIAQQGKGGHGKDDPEL